VSMRPPECSNAKRLRHRARALRSHHKARMLGLGLVSAMMPHDPDAPNSEFLQQEQTRLFGHVVGARVALLPVIITGIVTIALFEPFLWQRMLLGAVTVGMSFYFILELVRYRRHGLIGNAFLRNLVAGVFGQLSLAAATGGLLSPLIYPMVPLAFMMGVMLDPKARAPLLTIQLVGVWCFALAHVHGWPAQFGISALIPEGSRVLPAAHYYFHAGGLTLVVAAISQLGLRLRTGCTTLLGRELTVRHELLRTHDERVKELTSLSAEIAHELKNPLASVKGLSALLTQNIGDDKGLERLRVLRGEVDRMQSVLEEFLNFSRPLVPLALIETDAVDIIADVVALHEGLAQQRGLSLAFEGSHANTMRSDPRKVKQILINLVQNALDASPPSGTVTLSVLTEGAHVIVRVSDEGAGLDPSLDVFAPGVTSKSGGAGLGLTIARSLARQHGGELQLGTQAGGGTLATLALPKEPNLGNESPCASMAATGATGDFPGCQRASSNPTAAAALQPRTRPL
jgi:two-component system, NtrC family, sensor histidine kinase HydH